MNHQSRFDTGSLGLVHWDDPEGWYGEAGGRAVQDGEHVCPWRIHVDVPPIKINKFKLKKYIYIQAAPAAQFQKNK